MRRIYHVARADFLQRVRSRRLLVVLAVVAYLGYLVNVGAIELAYQIEMGDALTNVHGANTASFVGLKAGMTAAAVLLFGGFYLMKGTLERDRQTNVDQLVGTTPVTDREFLAGKWLSNIGYGVLVLATLGFATVVNHAVHGVGPTKPLALLGPIVAFGLPLCALVGAVSLLFESVERLRGTGGNVGYLLLATVALASLASAEGTPPSELPLWIKASDLLGHVAVYTLTADPLTAAVPAADGVLPSFGLLEGDQTFTYDGQSWPIWIYVQRAGLVLPALVVVLVAAVPFRRVRSVTSSEQTGRLSRLTALLPAVWSGRENSDPDETAADSQPVDSVSLTPVEDRSTGGFWRLVAAEVRLAVRGRRWWWYAGVAALVLVPIGTLLRGGLASSHATVTRQVLVPLAFVWPIFVWSEMGVRTTRHRLTALVLSSKYPVEQLVAEWIAGIAVAVSVSSGLGALFVVSGQPALLVGLASGAVFAPSLALAAGTWSQSSWLFELSYLMLWYVGPLNGATPVDFLGSTAASIETGVPLAFLGVGIALFGAALLHRKLELR
ncbi:ABC transporter permease [Halorientalis brevis]|uniref:ABC transporter permease n=1 Tax=Halorientalis brevis TaxID=1126241 RepID=A0ABD6C8T5_9EURY|nr:ABC transporter permease [Halorientalis brevis]